MRKNVPSCITSIGYWLSKLCVCITILLTIIHADLKAQPVFVKQLAPGSNNFVSNNGYLYYASGDSLWRSDGTPGGTTLVKKLGQTIFRISEIKSPTSVFIITQSGGSQSLWRSDGTNTGTVMVGTYNTITPLAVYNGELYLSINDGVHGVELWKLSSTNSLSLVKDINPGSGSGYLGSITYYNNSLFFRGGTSADANIWKTNGTEAGTVVAVDLPFNDFYELKASAGYLYFDRSYTDPEDEFSQVAELWRSQGTQASTQMVKIWGPEFSQYNGIGTYIEFNGKTYFIRAHGIPEEELWVTDGTDAGTQMVRKIVTDGFVGPIQIVRNNLVFADESQTFAGYIWKSDGTTAGTSSFYDIKELFADNNYAAWLDLTPAGDLLFFNDIRSEGEEAAPQDLQVYQSDLTAGGTRTLQDIYNVSIKGTANITASEDKIFFTSSNNEEGFRLWYYDPFAAPSLCSGTGGVVHELWKNVSGTTVSTIPVNTTPASTSTLSVFEGPSNIGDKYGSRYRALLCVPQTGDYRFWIASNDNSELWLSTTSSAADKVRIAYVNGASNPRQYNKYASQQSALIHLEKGKTYYIEALHKEGVGTDHISVGMQLPDGTLERPITGARLIPYKEENKAPIANVSTDEIVYAAPANVDITSEASDPDGAVVKVEFFNSGVKIGEDLTSPYSFRWENVPAGTYSITAVATDNEGATSIPTPTEIYVEGCSATGTILREVWRNVSGTSVSDIPVNSPPSETSQLSILESPGNIGTKYGTRIRGYICPPVTGAYLFYIASNDNSELWLSSNFNPANKVRIAYVNGATEPRQWNKYSSQGSVAINLVQNQTYYIEVLHKQGVGTDHVSVGWRLPDGTFERPIAGSRLSPFNSSMSETGIAATAYSFSETDVDTDGEIILAPNPTNKKPVTLFLPSLEPGLTKELKIEVTSLVGSLLYAQTISCTEGCNEVTLDITDKLSAGVYLVNGAFNGKRFTKRLIVK
ncbi:PA14 domain-containing protein [Chryseosolibacter indicus]|uniref:PA14 domain-containing protein n=1 Tax=Chryseosolibacter indicus TaxID=2782351 RepID=A0ABS5VY27_9BACT|nr:PA14 domain-containing protein [Chryseosolibacter indicus]MBT1705968.1 hypothetical protein [Chryseosolibacter indicus]